jgi:Mycothiol maleylpyruvate isomerase N-terminal domain
MTGADQAMWPGLLEPAIGYALAVVAGVTPELLPCPTPCRGWDVQMLLRHASESLAALQEGIDAGRIALDPAPDDPAADPADVFRDRAGRLLSAWTRVTGADHPCPCPPSPGDPPAFTAPAVAGDGRPFGGPALSNPPAPTDGAPPVGAPAHSDGPAPADGPPRSGGPADLIEIADRQLALGALIGVGALELAVHGWDLSRACGHRRPIPGSLATGLLDISPLLVPRTGRRPLFDPPVTVPPLATPSDQLVAYLGRNPEYEQR